jgi:hypothetical protein
MSFTPSSTVVASTAAPTPTPPSCDWPLLYVHQRRRRPAHALLLLSLVGLKDKSLDGTAFRCLAFLLLQ